MAPFSAPTLALNIITQNKGTGFLARFLKIVLEKTRTQIAQIDRAKMLARKIADKRPRVFSGGSVCEKYPALVVSKEVVITKGVVSKR
jgi:hypothetical protein